MNTSAALPAVAALALAVALAACAEQPAGGWHAAAAVPASPVPGGLWVVTDVFPSGTDGAGAERLVGQPVRLDADTATTPGGATCAHPSYHPQVATEAEFLGTPARVAEFPALVRTLAVVAVRCDGDEFGRYARWFDGSLMTRWDGAVLRLEPAPAVALQPPATAPMEPMEPATPEPPPAAMPAAAPPPAAASGKLLYLASYRGETTAKRGWAQLAKDSPTLAKLQPTTTTVTLPGKGRFVRLFARIHDAAEAKRVCAEVRRMLPECGSGP
jgi:hypothetical protein